METLVNKMEDCGFGVSFRKRNRKTILELNRNGEKLPFYEVDNGWITTLIIENKNHLFMTKEELFTIINYYHQKDQKPLLIHIHKKNGVKGKTKEYLLEKKYVELESDQNWDLESYVKGDLESENWVTTKDKEEIEKSLVVLRSLNSQINILYEELPLLDRKHRYEGYGIDNNGFEITVHLEKTENAYQLRIVNLKGELLKEWEVKTKEEVQETISQWIRKNYQQQRVKSIVEPSKKRFKNYIDSQRLIREGEKLYQEFLEHFSPLEIEIIFALYYKRQIDYKKINNNYDLFEYEGKIIFLSRKSVTIYVFEKNGNEQQNMIEIIQQETEDELKEIFKKIL